MRDSSGKRRRAAFKSDLIGTTIRNPVFVKIRDRAKKKYKDTFDEAASKLWDCYHAEKRIAFSQRIRRLIEWCKKNNMPSVIADPIKKLRQNIAAYKVAYFYLTYDDPSVKES